MHDQIDPRYLSLKEGMKFFRVGRPNFEKLADKAGARIKIGTGRTGRVIYDKEKIISYLDSRTMEDS